MHSTDPTHILIHRYTPGTGPQEGTPELDAEMEIWERIDRELRASGQLVSGWALREAVLTLGRPDEPHAPDHTTGSQIVFAVHAITAGSDAEAEQIAASMPHLSYGSTQVHPVMS